MKYLTIKIKKDSKVVDVAKAVHKLGFILKWNNNTNRVAMVDPN